MNVRPLTKLYNNCLFPMTTPDVWANLTLVLGAGYYLQYNATVYLDPSQVSE